MKGGPIPTKRMKPLRTPHVRVRYRPNMAGKKAQKFRPVRLKKLFAQSFHGMNRAHNMGPHGRNRANVLALRARIWPPRGIVARMQSGLG